MLVVVVGTLVTQYHTHCSFTALVTQTQKHPLTGVYILFMPTFTPPHFRIALLLRCLLPGATISGFIKVADVMLAHGAV